MADTIPFADIHDMLVVAARVNEDTGERYTLDEALALLGYERVPPP